MYLYVYIYIYVHVSYMYFRYTNTCIFIRDCDGTWSPWGKWSRGAWRAAVLEPAGLHAPPCAEVWGRSSGSEARAMKASVLESYVSLGLLSVLIALIPRVMTFFL